MNQKVKTIIVVGIFSIAMAALESAVVVYLRQLYYPDGFTVALRMIDERILLIEIVREGATLVMLCCVGYLVDKNFKERVAYFLLSFAVWDIFYYVWLKIFIDWPLSIFDWDILFLIPITWLAPVAAPVICSITMIVLAVVLLRSDPFGQISKGAWGLFIVGAVMILFTFLYDYSNIIIRNGLVMEYANIMQNEVFLKTASEYIPESYSWNVFWLGEIAIAIGIIRLIRENVSLRI